MSHVEQSTLMRRLSRRRNWLAPLAAAVALLVLAAPEAALAHAAMVKSDPAARAVLRRPPAQIRLWFNEPVEPAYSTITVTNQSDKPVSGAQTAAIDPADNQLLVLPVPHLPPGEYTVRARVLSRDGDVVNFRFTFTVKEPPPQK
jgi:copper resistance protein C